MKKHVLLISLLTIILTSLTSEKSFAQWNDDRWFLSDGSNPNGSFTIEVEYASWNPFPTWYGFVVERELIIKYFDEGGTDSWKEIGTIRRHNHPDTLISVDNLSGRGGWVWAESREVESTGQWFADITFLPPESHLYNKPLKIITVADGVTFGPKTLTAYKPYSIPYLTATTTHCNQVVLNWGQSFNILNNTGYYYIVRDFGLEEEKLLGKVKHPITTLTDYDIDDGESHTYNIVPFVEAPWRNEIIENLGEKSMDAVGHSLPHRDPPIRVQASDDDCDAQINISWEWTDNVNYPSGILIRGFEIQRSTKSDFSENPISFFVYGEDRSYTDASTSKGVIYFYRVATQNNCGESGNFSDYDDGMAPDIPNAPSNVNAVFQGSSIYVTWDDNSQDETGFKIIRKNLTNDALTKFSVNENIEAYSDNDILTCMEYEYEIEAFNDCGEHASGTPSQTSVDTDLNTSFENNALIASKGYYTDQITLNWYTKYANLLDHFKIYRKIQGSSNEAEVVATVDNSQENWNDLFADAGIMYEYTIKGVGICDVEYVYTNTVSSIGFRTATGVVSGNISFEGGVALEGGEVLVDQISGNTGSSVSFDGSFYGSIDGTNKLNPDTGISIELWLKPQSLDNDFTIIDKHQGSTGYRLFYKASTSSIVFQVGNSKVYLANKLVTNAFQQITATSDGSSLQLYYNGKNPVSIPYSENLNGNELLFILGASQDHISGFYNGFIDEIRIWDKGLTADEVRLNFSRIINGSEEGLMAYWRADEGQGNFLYDAARTSISFNENHMLLYGAGSTFSDWALYWSTVEIPAKEQLGLKGVTDSNGNYIINNIRYLGNGENFTLTPKFNAHAFEPNQRALYIGTGSEVHNNQDFTDASAFKFSGTVQYESTDCFIKGVYIYRDGELVISNGKAVQTDESGFFDIKVPIGEHVISVGMLGHTYVHATWPENGQPFNFQEPQSGATFLDNTLIKVVGRVVGGPVEAGKKPNLGLSKNNIGQAKIKFRSQNECLEKLIYTDNSSGEYSIWLPPMKYNIDEVSIASAPGILFGVQEVLDLTLVKAFTTVADTVYEAGTTNIDHIDTTSYQYQRDFIHRETPSVNLTNADGSEFIGDKETVFTSLEGESTTISLDPNPYPFPIITMNTRYNTTISVFEEYSNFDSGTEVIDRAPVTDAVLKVNNGLSKTESEQIFKMNSSNGEFSYSFSGGLPNPLTNGNKPEISFTKILTVDVESGEGGAISASWLPNKNSPGPYGEEIFRAFVLGARPKGSNFTTNGPDVVDFILRDPPGSESYAFLSKDSSYSIVESWTSSFGDNYSVANELSMGIEFEIGGGLIGPAIGTEVANNSIIGVNVTRKTLESGELVSTYSFNQTLQTSDDHEYVGALADLFVGQAKNMIYGLTDNLEFLPDTVNSSLVNIINDDAENGFVLALREGLFVNPDGFNTMFVYTQNHIENEVIPNLQLIRNDIFDDTNIYTKVFTDVNDPKYGANNDDPIWGDDVSTDTPIKTEEEDFSGSSYLFLSADAVDSVRHYNQQIRLWIDALARNEEDKLKATEMKNISFDAGAKVEETHTTTASSSHTTGWEATFDESISTEIGAKLGGFGYQLSLGFEITLEEGATKNTTIEKTSTFGYSLSEPDAGDYFSVDVKEPLTTGGFVFRTKGGQSSCPFEDKYVSKYYKPGTTISEATMKREIPVIDISPSNVYGVPEDEEAELYILLGNNSASGDDNWYETRVLLDSNPNGARIRIDGESANRAFEIKAGENISKRLTVEKGSSSINDYENLQIVFQSLCQNDFRSNFPVIADTITFSVHFVPTCTKIELMAPADKWIANYENNNILPITVSEYNINLNGFEKFSIEYKKKNSSIWAGLITYYKDTTGLNDPQANLIDDSKSYTTYLWDLSEIIDGEYDIRATTTCPLAGNISSVVSGVIDRINPHPFGTPQPADGVLQPNDEIMIQFNEKINGNLLNRASFDIRGVLNGTEVSHGTSISFDGLNSNYVNIPEGISLDNKSFTLEIWAKRNALGEQCMISQGTANLAGISMGFDINNHFEFTVSGYSLASDEEWTDSNWHHWAACFNQETGEMKLFRDGTLLKLGSFMTKYVGTGRIQLAKSTFGSPKPFSGNLHEFRIWNTYQTQSKIVAYMNYQLNGMEEGLIGNWRLDEAFGSRVKDIVHYRNGTSHGTWSIYPSGKSFSFDGIDDYLELTAGDLLFTDEIDFTIEFWFKSDQGINTTLFSNGKGDLTGTNESGWAIRTDSDGNILLFNQGLTFNIADNSYWDDNWHHLAITVSRLGNIIGLIDGEQQATLSSSGWGAFGGSKIWIGSRGWFEVLDDYHDQYFEGLIDEVRIWKTARKQDQINRDMNHRVGGDEIGLVAYYPFEDYEEDGGILILKNSLKDLVEDSPKAGLVFGGATYATSTPNIKLKRPIRKVNFNWAFNEDKIILTPTDPSSLIENTILDITVKGVKDMYGNEMQSPVTWSAYVDRNQVTWEDERLNFEKILYDPLTFSATIVNSGGNQQAFSINNLPGWLEAVPQQGTLQPLSSQTIQFRVNSATPIGYYSFDAYLHTSFNFDEKLLIDLRVYTPGPEWTVNPLDYQFTMNLIGQLSVDGVLSNDVNDMLAAFVGDECRGVSNLRYIPEFDMYEVFMDIYSNIPTGEDIIFRVWNASEGLIHTDVTPVLQFVHNSVLGLPSEPIPIVALNTLQQEIPIAKGWNWISFNLRTTDLYNPDLVLKNLPSQPGSIVKGQGVFDAFSSHSGWNGTLSLGGGFSHESMYKLFANQGGQIIYTGSKLNAATVPIPLNKNWNWVGFTPSIPMPLSQALGFYNAQSGDLIKSQTGFSVYDNNLGWIGSLSEMKPNHGYMMKVAQAGSFFYPDAVIFGEPLKGLNSDLGSSAIDPSKFQYNMSVVAQLMTQNPESGEHMEISIWSNTELRGRGSPKWDESLGGWKYYLTSHGFTDTENLRITAMDKRTNTEYTVKESVIYSPDDVIGTVEKPLQLHLAGSTSGIEDYLSSSLNLGVYPNPFSERIEISYFLDEASYVQVEIYDVLGQKVRVLHDSYQAGGNIKISWDGLTEDGALAAQGTYLIHIITNKERVNRRIVKIPRF